MRHLIVISGAPSETSIIDDRIQNYVRSTYSKPIVKSYEVSDEYQSHTLILTASDESLLPKLYMDKAVGCWLVTLGPWFAGTENDHRLQGSLEEICSASDILAHPSLQGLDAAFCIVSGTLKTQQLRVITDRIGTLHVYTQQLGGTNVVSTSSLLLAAASKPAWNTTAVQQFLATGTVFGTRTLFDGIHKLLGATQTIFPAGKPPQIEKYWDISDSFSTIQNGSAIERLAEALEASIQSMAQRLGTPVLSLTGGLDSRIIFAAALKSGIPFETYTTGEPDSADVVIAREIGAEFGVRHHHLDISPVKGQVTWASLRSALLLCDGQLNALRYPRIFDMHEQLSKRFDFSVSGSGGEFCKGYWWELLWPAIGKKMPLDAGKIIDKRFLTSNWVSQLLAPDSQVDVRGSLIDAVQESNKGLSTYPNTMQLDNVYLTLRMQKWQGRIASGTSQIWPTVSPFMCNVPMEIAFSASPHERIRNKMSRALNEYLNPALAKKRIDQGGPALPFRPGTVLEFLPALLPILEKIVEKTGSRISRQLGRQAVDRHPGEATTLEHYQGLAQFNDIANWQTSEFYDTQKLAGFVRKYFEHKHPIDRPFGRLISLEGVARHLNGRL